MSAKKVIFLYCCKAAFYALSFLVIRYPCMQALEHARKAIEFSNSNSTKADAYHLQGGVLKDLKRMEEAETVSLILRGSLHAGFGAFATACIHGCCNYPVPRLSVHVAIIIVLLFSLQPAYDISSLASGTPV